ncbi:hypothetical protein E3Q10_02843 [Wallemia mellicola]|uniref:Sulfhydryl oxidase n=2 Tax=Wallemia mellicola TaxID=1708541 RepID=A0A4T0RXS3_9BASI|nr:hypothetical protein E3Q19_01888 [Wallemia mellicola]TIC10353.1 hypothetical protein E3Q14_02856 [Wallemia mellicola]TIC28961.1 hypothetical protein E3Q10_02843 [Wallemia mellicola]TIC43008.1 hypothetical protein E3Q08_02516 [Wallemia mellicola]
MNFARKLIAAVSIIIISITIYLIHLVQPFELKFIKKATAPHDSYKADLGHSSWKLLHHLTLRFPEHPTHEESKKLEQFFYLFSELYPCDECSHHFQQILSKFPPQTSSNHDASSWLCGMHNLVNQRLNKPSFDCSTLSDHFDCDCSLESDLSSSD